MGKPLRAAPSPPGSAGDSADTTRPPPDAAHAAAPAAAAPAATTTPRRRSTGAGGTMHYQLDGSSPVRTPELELVVKGGRNKAPWFATAWFVGATASVVIVAIITAAIYFTPARPPTPQIVFAPPAAGPQIVQMLPAPSAPPQVVVQAAPATQTPSNGPTIIVPQGSPMTYDQALEAARRN